MEKCMAETKTLNLEQKWESLTLANNFIFYKVMRHHPDACKHLIEMLLGIKIEKMEMHNEEVIDIDYDSKGVRLDVFVKDSGRMYDIELQVANTHELPERSRYYSALMALDSLKEGEPYKSLKDSHVIFICMSDIFDQDLPVYTFENICLEDNKIKLKDRDFRHFFIAPTCAKMIEDEEVKSFFNFLISNSAKSRFTSMLSGYVNNAKRNMQWRVQYMTWARQRYYDFEDGKQAGIAEGREEGAQANARENAKNFAVIGLPPETVSKGCSLPLEQVLALRDELKLEI